MAAGRGGAGRAAEVTHSGRAGGAGRGAQLWLRAGAVRRRRRGGGGSRYRERRARLPPSPPPPSRFSAGPLHAPPPGEGSTGAQGQAGPVRAWRAGAGPGSLFTSPPGLGGGESGEGLPRGRWEGEKIAPSPHPPNPLFRGVAARPGGDRRRLVPLAGRQRWDCGGQRLPRVREGGWVVARAAGRCWGRSWGGWEARTAERRRGGGGVGGRLMLPKRLVGVRGEILQGGSGGSGPSPGCLLPLDSCSLDRKVAQRQ